MLRLNFNKKRAGPLDFRKPRGYAVAMDPSRLALAAALLCSGAGASAQAAAADTQACVGWSPAYRKEVKEIFTTLLEKSKYDDPKTLAKEREADPKTPPRGPTELIYWEKDRLMEGSPMVALAARTGPNTKDHAIVVVTYGALEIGDKDHVAFMMAHEIAHLLNHHPQQFAAIQAEVFEQWYSANGVRVAMMSPKDAVEAFSKEKNGELGERNRPFERQADKDGLDLMAKAGYDAGKAGDSMDRAQDWLAALHLDKDDPAHDPLAVRAAQLRTMAARMQGVRARMADVTASGPN